MTKDAADPNNWDWAQLEPELSPTEKSLRDLFVNEYLVDYSPISAAQRCGFQHAFAKDYAIKFMQEAYVQKQIKNVEQSKPAAGEDKEEEYDKRRIKKKLLEEAFFTGAGSSHAARVSALGKLAAIYGMDAPLKSEQTVTHKGGVLMVPAISDVNSWETVAQESQQKLVQDARH